MEKMVLTHKKQHNFTATLPATLAGIADSVLRNTYNLDFLYIEHPVIHTANHKLDRVKQLLTELGNDFCFVSSHHELLLNNKEVYIDLLFYHRALQCLVAVDIRPEPYKAECAGRMNLWLNLINDVMKREDENRALGLILCTGKDEFEVEYSLKSLNNPIGVSCFPVCSQKIEKPEAVLKNAPALSRMIHRLNIL